MSITHLLAAASTPSPTADPANTYYSPGVIGFLAVFFVTAFAILLIFDMVRRIRRVRYRAEIQEKLAAEQVAKTAANPRPAPKKPSAAKASGTGRKPN